MNTHCWQPSADIASLKQRGALIRKIRDFFYQRDVLEVETPNLSQASVSDMHLASFSTQFIGPGYGQGLPLYLQTSPEYAMKRLLAAGSGAIFQIAKAFRNEESGRYHNPEFTMLEWYRPGFTHFELMDEIDELMQLILNCAPANKLTYQMAFQQVLGLDPLTATLADLKQLCNKHGFEHIAQYEQDPDTLLQLLFSMKVEPEIGQNEPCFIYDFPASQAALAKISDIDNKVALRFELYYKNMELANGFNELTDASEQKLRFNKDNEKRHALGLPQVSIDENFIAAIESGLPACSGVALGIDRLMMLALDKNNIQDVLSFDVSRC